MISILRSTRNRCVVAAVVIMLAMGGSVLQAQLPTATALGVVRDSTGAVVPGANVTIRNLDTGQTRTAVTNSDGSYRVPALPVGNYEIRAEHAGFQVAVRSGLALAVSQEAVVNFTMEVGAMEQEVTVMAAAPLVNTTSGSLGGLVDEQKVADLPLNGRNYIDLTLLQPGVTEQKNHGVVVGTAGTRFSSNGAPTRSNNYLLDGASMGNIIVNSSSSVSGSTLGVEGIREYRVITNSFSAEYGMSMGSQMIIVSKGGTNSFHGSVFEFLRNSALDARNFFDKKTLATPRRLPPFTRNNFGASFGGPIRKDRTFFFGVYEALRERLGITTVDNVPGAGCHGPAGATITNAACSQLGTQVASVTVAPVIAPLLTLFPAPNLPNNLFTFPYSQPTTQNYGQMRVDHTFSTNDSMFGRYTIDDTSQNRTLAFPQFKGILTSRNQFSTVSENHVFSPNLLNTVRFSYSRTYNLNLSPSGILGPQFSLMPGKEVGTIAIGGVTSLGPDGTSPSTYRQNLFTWSDDLFYTRGRHSLKYGTLINRFRQYMQARTNERGTVNFPSIGGFLQGQVTNYIAATPGSILDRSYQFSTFGFYGQDDFRVSSRLTLNLGLRYEFNTQPVETQGHGAALRDIQHDANTTLGEPYLNPSLKNFSPRFGFAWDVFGNGNTALRGGFGLLYDIAQVNGGIVVGVTATPPFSSQSSIASTPANPVALSLPLSFPASAAGRTLRTQDYHMPQTHMMQYNLTLERQLPGSMALTLAYGGSRGVNIQGEVEGNPTVPQGSKVNGVCVPTTADRASDLNRTDYCWTGTDPRTNPNWGPILLNTGGRNSWYNSLQFGLIKRLSKGLQFQSAYTWSKTIDETQGQLGGDDVAQNIVGSDPTHRKTDRGPASFDLRHNLRFNAIYQLPRLTSGGIAAKLVSGWWVSGILSVQTGYPFTVALQSNRSRSGVQTGSVGIDRPDLVAGRSNDNIVSGTTAGCQGVAAGRNLGTADLYYDPCAFSIPVAGFLGTAGRSILRGPSLSNVDFSIVKDAALSRLGDAGRIEFRTELFNLLNRPNFSIPNRVIFTATQNVEAPLANAGQITSTSTSSRQIQFGLKLIF